MNREPTKYDKMRYASMNRSVNADSARLSVSDSCTQMHSGKCDSDNESALSFAAWELRLYLNTHPDDERALEAYRKLCASHESKCNYACHTDDARGGIGHTDSSCGCADNTVHGSHKGGRVWHWIDDPWPWELAANMKGGDC